MCERIPSPYILGMLCSNTTARCLVCIHGWETCFDVYRRSMGQDALQIGMALVRMTRMLVSNLIAQQREERLATTADAKQEAEGVCEGEANVWKQQ